MSTFYLLVTSFLDIPLQIVHTSQKINFIKVQVEGQRWPFTTTEKIQNPSISKIYCDCFKNLHCTKMCRFPEYTYWNYCSLNGYATLKKVILRQNIEIAMTYSKTIKIIESSSLLLTNVKKHRNKTANTLQSLTLWYIFNFWTKTSFIIPSNQPSEESFMIWTKIFMRKWLSEFYRLSINFVY